MHSLRYFTDTFLPDFIFLSEPGLYQCDLDLAMGPFRGEYSSALNSSDLYDPGIPMAHSAAYGGTMILWKIKHDPHISIVPVDSSSFLPIIFSPPGYATTVHICIYLPTQGKENQFLGDMAKLDLCIDKLRDQHPEIQFFLRGDFNVNENNIQRINLLQHFCDAQLLNIVPINHKTYHHFMGNGLSDSHLDKLLFSSGACNPEKLSKIICKKSNPLIGSHHDMLVSEWNLPPVSIKPINTTNIKAPRLSNERAKVLWSEAGILEYKNLVAPQLTRIQNLWLDTPSPSRSSLKLLLQSTNNILTTTASITNKTIDLGKSFSPRSKPIPKLLRISQKSLLQKHRELKHAEKTSATTDKILQLKLEHKQLKSQVRKLERQTNAIEGINRDELLFSICSDNPSLLYKSVRNSKNGGSGKINKLKVGD